MHRISLPAAILVSIVVSIPACHAGDPGSIPGRGGLLLVQPAIFTGGAFVQDHFTVQSVPLVRLQHKGFL